MHYGRIDSTTNSLKFPLSRPCNAGEQCFLSYGNFSSSHLVTFYGFFTQGDNPHDVISLGTALYYPLVYLILIILEVCMYIHQLDVQPTPGSRLVPFRLLVRIR